MTLAQTKPKLVQAQQFAQGPTKAALKAHKDQSETNQTRLTDFFTRV